MNQQHQFSDFSLIKISHKCKNYNFDLEDAFHSLKLNTKIIEAGLKDYPEILYNSELFRLKALIEKALPVAIDIALKLMAEDEERNVIYNQLLHDFEITSVEVIKYSPELCMVEIGLTCIDENREILYTYDSRGSFYVEFSFDVPGNIINTKIS